MRNLLLIFFIVINAFAYKIVEVQKRPVRIIKEYTGDTFASKQVMLSTRLMGYIKNIAVKEGDVVRKGDFLFEVDPSDIASMINQARAGVMQAQNGVFMAKLAYSDAEKDYERFSNLYKQGAVSKRTYDKMTLNRKIRASQVKMAEAMLAQARAGLAQAQAQIKYSKIYSPTDGVVVRKMGNIGDMALPGRPILILSDLKSVQARAFIKSQDIKIIKKGQKAKIYFPSLNESVEARVSSVILSGDPATHSYLVKFKFPYQPEILPGMYAKIKVEVGEREEVTIPYNALTSRFGEIGIFVNENGVAKFRKVKILSQNNGEVSVSNVEEGEEVVVNPPVDMKDSTILN
jgi:RND family efflux transporter MFP subunit